MVLAPFDGSLQGDHRFLAHLPTGAELVELEVEPGVRLRGVFVPSDPGAPVVLHLLESSASVASQAVPKDAVLWDLSEAGYASLMIDYRGVGLSDGQRSPRNLLADARAMYAEALVRAGVDEQRVLVRATSLGSIAAAQLLADGARPACAIWIVPVQGSSITRRFAREVYGRGAEILARMLYGPAAPHELSEMLEQTPVPSLMIAGRDDSFLPPDERRRLAAAVHAAGGRVVERKGNHLFLTLLAQALLPEELEFLRERYPAWPLADPRVARLHAGLDASVLARFREGMPERARLDALAALSLRTEPLHVAAAAFVARDEREAFRLLALERGRWLEGLDFDTAAAALSLEDPDGRLDLELIEIYSRYFRLVERFGMRFDTFQPLGRFQERLCTMTPDDPEITFRASRGKNRASISADLRAFAIGPDGEPLEVEAARRRMARTLFKAMAAPERLRRTTDGTALLEVRRADGAWVRFALGDEGEGQAASIDTYAKLAPLPAPDMRESR